jgi:hypothetical protein
MMTQFSLEYRNEGEKTPIRDPGKIAINYLKKDFALDLLTLIPFFFLNLKRYRENLFYLIKMLRIIKGFNLFDVPRIMAYIKI